MGLKAIKREWRRLGVFIIIVLAVFSTDTRAQSVIVDKTVATVSDGVRTEVITLSDLKWQLAVQSNAYLTPPSKDDLDAALRRVIDQRIFALEAERIPRPAPSESEIKAKIDEVLRQFSTAEFERRLNAVGFKSVSDPNFQRMMGERVAIEKYLDFRFRSFIVVTADDEAKYYRDIYVAEFRKNNPALLIPSLESKRSDINRLIVEDRIAQQMETFLDEAKRRVEIVILMEP
ncbi:MAG TPA: hypothetical protein VJL58_01665 [Pyrinomonadaceae bacterium]|nr:hypothetical protein [Pyrinomonadaceae bacterium]